MAQMTRSARTATMSALPRGWIIVGFATLSWILVLAGWTAASAAFVFIAGA
jgi:hypothetical protein